MDAVDRRVVGPTDIGSACADEFLTVRQLRYAIPVIHSVAVRRLADMITALDTVVLRSPWAIAKEDLLHGLQL